MMEVSKPQEGGMELNEKIAALRERMRQGGVDLFMVTTEDAYLAESAVDYWRSLRWLTGFSGTLAYAMVTQDAVSFWTDARYVIQARHQVQIDQVKHYDVTKVGADYYLDWIRETLSAMEGDQLVMAVDGRTITASRGLLLQENLRRLHGKSCTLRTDLDLVGDIWKDFQLFHLSDCLLSQESQSFVFSAGSSAQGIVVVPGKGHHFYPQGTQNLQHRSAAQQEFSALHCQQKPHFFS